MHRPIDRRLIVFVGFGVLATSVYAAVASALIKWSHWSPLPASAVAFLAAVGFSYCGNTVLGFRQQPDLRSLRRFLTVSIIGMAITLLITAAGEWLGADELMTIAVVVAVLPLLSFLAHVHWTYRAEGPE